MGEGHDGQILMTGAAKGGHFMAGVTIPVKR
jgi:hypothetical protein